jgi:hypothetical protein
MDATPQECPGRNDDGSGAKPTPLESFDSDDGPASFIDYESRNRTLNGLKQRLLLEKRPHRPSIQTSVALSAWRPNCRTFAPVEHPELKRRQIGGSAHDSTQRVDLANDRSLGDTADRWIARHLADRLERARDDRYARPSPRGCHTGLGSGVAGSDNDDVERCLEILRRAHSGHPGKPRDTIIGQAAPGVEACRLASVQLPMEDPWHSTSHQARRRY